MVIRLWAVLFLAFSSCRGAIHESISDLPGLNFDFIVVGGGTAGNVVANRLTETARFSVLVLEAGPSNAGVLDSDVPGLEMNLLRPNQFNWNFTTIPQEGLNGRSIPYPRGHILGGSSAINAMFYTRGSSDDFDRFAKVTNDAGWAWNSIQPLIRKNERWTEPTDHHDTKGQFDPRFHSFTGINSVSLGGFPRSINGRVIEATRELPDEFPFNVDYNSGRPLGLGWLQATIGHGHRSSSATSYLAPKFTSRPNLHVLLHARVTRILQGGERKQFSIVEFAPDSGVGPTTRVTASREIILSAGSYGTPHILMHSGIGDSQELSALGINVVHDLPSVGKNLSDHPGLFNSWLVNSTKTDDEFTRNATLFEEVFRQWNRTHTGPLGDAPASHLVWSRVPSYSPIFSQFSDPSAGINAPHIELIITNGNPAPPPTGNFLSIGTAVVSPISRGWVRLNSSNPFDPPLINPGFLSSNLDVLVMRTAVKLAKRFLEAPVWKGYILEPFGALANVTTDEEIDAYIRDNSGTTCHVVGTAAMSAPDAPFGVVNPDLRVKGVQGLRIVDASIFPFVPAAHTQAPTYIVAERAAELIKATWVE